MRAVLTVALLGDTALGVVLAVLPLAALFLVFQTLFLRLPRAEVVRVLAGTALAAAGLFLFLLGVGMAFLPFGRIVGAALGALPHPAYAAIIGAALGFVTCWGEPAVRVLAGEVEDASGGSLPRTLVVPAVSVGVAVAVAVGLLRIDSEIPLKALLVPGYAAALVLVALSKPTFAAVAADASGVATGPLANSFLLALALGAAGATGRDNPLVDGLGLVSLIALAPVLSVTALGLMIRLKERRSRR